MRTAIQLWTLRNVDAPLSSLFHRIAVAGYDGVEFAGLGDPSERTQLLDAAGLLPVGVHVGTDELRADPAAIDDELETLDAPYAVVPYLDDDHFADAAAVDETAATLDRLARDLDRPLLYHNHVHEFVPVDDETAFDRLIEQTAVSFELDAGWAQAAGRDPVSLIRKLDGRVPVVHLKDVTADGDPTHLGEGVVDLPAVVAAAREAGTDWLVFEYDDPDDPLAAMEKGIEAMDRLLAEA
ncbi:sugar phosphate isomerase/epimerase family protein [Haloarcula nitratireducens]|uniref:Sugar phosphate isomerase/epimerase n=1 Tax=Haloarcula nitratireducens TaxID=2487749 RepID=A0AAW4PA66_9EURY|nr:sugar phosphate isomerase/epimerase [Halomicroarcula nitratireducens]MBX0294789.1 sugar phosphate isomerase/epimerase [Halomicroarcula nitratireducens]